MKLKFRFSLSFLLSCVLMGFGVNAATSISGYVKQATGGFPIKNALVKHLESGETVYTQENGQFSITVGEGSDSVILVVDHAGFVVQQRKLAVTEKNAVFSLVKKQNSSATARWLDYIESDKAYNTLSYEKSSGWEIVFETNNLKGDFAPDSTMIRRDPSAVIEVDGVYYDYYTRGTRYREDGSEKFFPWAECDVWWASSTDGITWTEGGLAVARGETGSFDDSSVFTPEVLAHEGKYYLVYQCVQDPYIFRVKNTVGMAVADSPRGPWKKLNKPILQPTNNGIWDDGDGHEVVKKGDFDSHKVHDPCLMYYNDKFYLYYKGERMGEERIFGQREIKWGVAIAETPTGPYVKSPFNPLTNSGHEVCVWPYHGGIALIHTDDGPERHTIQWAPDGINFEIMGTIGKTPKAFGIFRTPDHDKSPVEGIRWGLSHAYGGDHWRTGFNYIKRFDVVE